MYVCERWRIVSKDRDNVLGRGSEDANIEEMTWRADTHNHETFGRIGSRNKNKTAIWAECFDCGGGHTGVDEESLSAACMCAYIRVSVAPTDTTYTLCWRLQAF